MRPILYMALCALLLLLMGSCSQPGSRHVIAKERLTWAEASARAVSMGAYLAEIQSPEELALINELVRTAKLNPVETTAPDGGGGAYVWLGGNDLANEGAWIWDGNNDGSGSAFWTGDSRGQAENQAFTAWGLEPDDYLKNQDGLALSLNGWPLGEAGQWNDVSTENRLYFIVEYDTQK